MFENRTGVYCELLGLLVMGVNWSEEKLGLKFNDAQDLWGK